MKNFPLRNIHAVLVKDLKSEFRTRYAISAVLLFILTTITMIVFSTAGEVMTEGIAAGILWVIIFFAAMTGLSKSFVSEEERGTGFLLQLTASSAAVYFGKLLFNILLGLTLNFFATFLFFIFTSSVSILHFDVFIGTIFMGSLGIASATTIISAIIAKANSRNALFPVLSFPVLLPIILLSIQNTHYAFDGSGLDSAAGNFNLIFAYCGILVTGSYLLFDMVWKD